MEEARNSERLRILHAAYWHTPASLDVANDTANRHDIFYIATRSAVKWLAEDEWQDLFDPRIHLRVERDRRRRDPLYYVDRVVGLWRGLRGFRADVVHIQETRDPFTNTILSRLRDPAVVLTVHDAEPHPGETPKGYDALKRRMFAVRRRADRIICHSQAVRSQLLQLQPELDPKRVSVVLHPAIEYMLRWRRPEYVERPGTILFFGRIHVYKGIAVLLEAWKRIREACPEARLVVAGQGPDLAKHRSEIVADPRCELIECVVPTQEVSRLFAEASVIAFPYIEASQSGALAIAIAFEKPVVVSRVGGLPEMVQDGRSGLVVPPRDPQALADALIRVLQDEPLRREMQAGAAELRRGRFSPKMLAMQMEGVYQQAIEFHRSRPRQ